MISGDCYITYFKITVLSSSQKIPAPESSNILRLGMEDMYHPWVLVFKRHWLEDEMIAIEHVWYFYQWVAPSLIPEHVRQSWLADLTLKLPPINACIVSCHLPILLGLKPSLDAIIVNELTATSTLTDLEKRIVLIELSFPVKSALGKVLTYLRRLMHRFLMGGLMRARWRRNYLILFFLILLLLFCYLSLLLSLLLFSFTL